jgi:GAF domain-containing protein
MHLDFEAIGAEAQAMLAPGAEPTQALQAACQLLRSHVPHYNWVGFYVIRPTDPGVLHLGPYAGAATDHVRIPFGRGICGQAAEQNRELWIDDVRLETNYLACSLETRAEVVIPIHHGGRMVGQLDIDSHTTAPFSAQDHAFLREISTLAAPHLAILAL